MSDIIINGKYVTLLATQSHCRNKGTQLVALLIIFSPHLFIVSFSRQFHSEILFIIYTFIFCIFHIHIIMSESQPTEHTSPTLSHMLTCKPT